MRGGVFTVFAKMEVKVAILLFNDKLEIYYM